MIAPAMLANALLGLLLLAQVRPGAPTALERWRDAVELDLPREALREMAEQLSAQGSLRASGEARYLAVQLASGANEPRLLELALDPAGLADEQRAWLSLCRARIALSQDAFAECAQALRLDARGQLPAELARLPESDWLLGKLLDRQGRSAAARAPLERFVQNAPLSPQAPAAWHMLARGARESADLERARACTQSGLASAQWHSYYRARRIQLREAPDDPLPRLGLAQLMIAAQRDDIARLWLEELNTRWPSEPRGWLEFARLEQRAGALERARAHHQRYLELGGKEPLEPASKLPR
jgi:hypothetical protein